MTCLACSFLQAVSMLSDHDDNRLLVRERANPVLSKGCFCFVGSL